MSPSFRIRPLNAVIGSRFQNIRLTLIGHRLTNNRLINHRLINGYHRAPAQRTEQWRAGIIHQQIHVIGYKKGEFQDFRFAEREDEFLGGLLIVLGYDEHKVLLATAEGKDVGVGIADALLHRRQV